MNEADHHNYNPHTQYFGTPFGWPISLARPVFKENLVLKVLISTSTKRPPLLKGNFSGAKGVASQEEFQCLEQ